MYAQSINDQYNPPLPKPLSTEVRLAWKATCNTVFGGCSALTVAKRIDRIKKTTDAEGIVADVYSRSTGKPCEYHGAWECRECGQVYVGREDAERCCSEFEEFDD